MATITQPLLSARALSVSFGAKAVVHNIDFDIQAGERLALVGESGSGKTVSALALLRLAQEAKLGGEVWFGGRNLLALSAREMQAVRGQDIAMIFQEPMTALNPVYTVGNQIAEVFQLKAGLDLRSAWRAAEQALARTGIEEPERRALAYPHQLSGGQRQRAMIAMALACAPKLLIADEPTTALDVSLRLQMLDLLRQLQQQNGMAVLLITHDLNLVRRFAQRVAVMQSGHIVEQGNTEALFAAPQHTYTRHLLSSHPQRDVMPAQDNAPVLARASGLGVAYAKKPPGVRGWFRQGEFVALQGANFDLRAGQTLAVVGESGSGKSSLALAVLGLIGFKGELSLLNTQRWHKREKHNRELRAQVQVVFQDPFSSLSPRMTVQEIVSEGLRIHEPTLGHEARRQRVAQALADVGLQETEFPGLLERYPHEFSGGQRQRLAIARALIVRPKVLVLDEPTSALDVTVQQQVLGLLQRLQRERGLAYLLITHDIAVVRAMAHQVLVLQAGQVLEQGPAQQVLETPQQPYTRALLQAAA